MSRQIGLLQTGKFQLVFLRLGLQDPPIVQTLFDISKPTLVAFPLSVVVGGKHPYRGDKHRQARKSKHNMQQLLVVPGLFGCGHG